MVVGVAHHDLGNPLLQVGQILRKTKDCHQFRSRRNVKAGFTRYPLHYAAQTGYHVAQHPVVNVSHPLPDNATWVQVQFVVSHDVVIDQSCQRVVGTGQGMQVTRKVQVDVFHWHDLAVAAASCATLDPKDWAHGWFPHCDYGLVAQQVQSIPQADQHR